MKVNDSDSEALVGKILSSGSATNCYYWAAGYKQDETIEDWTDKWTDWSPDIWDIPESPSGGFTKATPCLPKLKCFE